MKKLKLSAMCRPLIFLVMLSLPMLSLAENNNAGKEQKAGQATQEQLDTIEKRRKKYESLSKTEQKKVRDARKKYKEMTPEERRKLKEKWKKIQDNSV
jgi:thymidylate kinase